MLEQSGNFIKPISEYTFSELVDMKREQFDMMFKHDESSVGYLTNLKKLLSLQYDSIKVQIDALSKMSVDSSTDEETKVKCLTTIQNMYAILFSLEYKACVIHQKIQNLTAQM